MSLKNGDNSLQKEESAKPLRRSLRLSSCSPTLSRVLTRSAASEAVPEVLDPSKPVKKRRLSFSDSSKKENVPVTRSVKKVALTESSTVLSETEKENDNHVKENEDQLSSLSPQKENLNKISIDNDARKTRNKITPLEQISEVDEDKIIKRVTRSQAKNENLMNGKDHNNKISENKEKNEFPIVVLKPIKEVFESITVLSSECKEPEVADSVDNKKQVNEEDDKQEKENIAEPQQTSQEEIINCEKENVSTEDEDVKNENTASTKSESDSFSVASDVNFSDVETDTQCSNVINDENKSVSSENKIDQEKESGNSIFETEKMKDTEAASLTNPRCSSENITENSVKDDISHQERKEELDNEKINDSSSVEQNSEINCSDSQQLSKENELESKIDNLINTHSFSASEDGDEDVEEHPFIATMAEEGEEDTPSEGSNDIIEIGEEINTTDSEWSSDESYDNSSFIDDEENNQLLSGEEFDLSLGSPKKKSRIIDLSSGSDDEIVRINRVKKEKPQKRKSRIVKFSDSSEEEGAFDDVKETEIPSQKDSDENKNTECKESVNDETENRMLTENEENKKDPAVEIESQQNDETISNEVQMGREENNKNSENVNSMPEVENHILTEQDIVNFASNTVSENMRTGSSFDKSEAVSVNGQLDQTEKTLHETEDYVHTEQDILTFASSTPKNIRRSNSFDKSEAVTIDNEMEQKVDDNSSPLPENVQVEKVVNKPQIKINECTVISNNDDNNLSNISAKFFNANSSIDDHNLKKKVVVIENIRVQDVKNKRLSDHINEVIDSLASGINEANEVSINLSVEYSNKSAHNDEQKNERKINTEIKTDEKNKIFNQSLDGGKSKKKKKNRKRKLSLNLSEEKTENTKKCSRVVNEKLNVEKISQGINEVSEETSNLEKKKKRNKRRKRKHDTNELRPSVSNKIIDEEPSLVKRKKRNIEKTRSDNNDIKFNNILDEALLDYQKTKLVLSMDIPENDEWNIKNIAIKPSKIPTQKNNTIERKTIKCSTSENPTKFHSKDFKNIMSFDSSRIKRVDTKTILKKKSH